MTQMQMQGLSPPPPSPKVGAGLGSGRTYLGVNGEADRGASQSPKGGGWVVTEERVRVGVAAGGNGWADFGSKVGSVGGESGKGVGRGKEGGGVRPAGWGGF